MSSTCCGEGPPRVGLRVRRCAWAVQVRADTHSHASCIVFSVFFIVSFAFVSLIVIMSLRTVERRWWMAGIACG